MCVYSMFLRVAYSSRPRDEETTCGLCTYWRKEFVCSSPGWRCVPFAYRRVAQDLLELKTARIHKPTADLAKRSSGDAQKPHSILKTARIHKPTAELAKKSSGDAQNLIPCLKISRKMNLASEIHLT